MQTTKHDSKSTYPYNYGWLQSTITQSVRELENLISPKGNFVKKSDLKRILKTLKNGFAETQFNLGNLVERDSLKEYMFKDRRDPLENTIDFNGSAYLIKDSLQFYLKKDEVNI